MAKSRITVPPFTGVNARPKNHLLAALPAEDFHRVLPNLKTVKTRPKQVFQKDGAPIEFVYFLNGGVGSMTTILSDGAMVESATIGNEGMIGIEAFYGANAKASGETIMQVPDTDAEMMSVEAFREEMERHGAFHNLMARYAQVMLVQTMQATACMARHPLEERCCRWLLEAHDRMNREDFHVSHEFLAIMLGVRRQTVTVVAGTLQRAGFIKYTHGHVTILDRKALEAASCECYAVIRRQFDQLRDQPAV